MRKLLKKKVNVFGKGIPVFAIVILGLALVSAALLPYFGKITGLVTVTSQGLLVDGLSYPGSQEIEEVWEDSTFTSLEERTYVNVHTLTNEANVQANGSIVSECVATKTNCTGIDYRAVEYFDDAGVQAYDIPSGATPITDFSQITGSGDYVIKNGVTLNSDVTITYNNVKVYAETQGFTIDGPGKLVVTGSGFLIQGFKFIGSSKYGLELGYNADNAEIRNNEFSGNHQHGLYINPASGIVVENNVFDVTGVAIGSDGHTGTIVRKNVFTDKVTEVMGASGTYDVDFTENNILTGAPLNDASGGVGDFNAIGNYFAEGINTVGTVNADWMTKTDFSIAPQGVDKFATLASFPKMLVPDIYTITTTVEPAK